MEQPSKEMIKKWATALVSMGMDVSEYETTEEFQTLLPITMKVSAQTIGLDLGSASKEEINNVKIRVQSQNRDGKIESIIENKEFTENKLEDDEEYKQLSKKGVTPMSSPSISLLYFDFQYESIKPHKKTRRGKKKSNLI
jgi:hypothetical protein